MSSYSCFPSRVGKLQSSILASFALDDFHPFCLDESFEDERVSGRVDCGHQRKIEFLKLAQLRPGLSAPLSDGYRDLLEAEVSADLAHSHGELATPWPRSRGHVRPSLGDTTRLRSECLSLPGRHLPPTTLPPLHRSTHLL